MALSLEASQVQRRAENYRAYFLVQLPEFARATHSSCSRSLENDAEVPLDRIWPELGKTMWSLEHADDFLLSRGNAEPFLGMI